MKKILLFSILFISIMAIRAQTFTVSTDSAFCIRQINSNSDTATINISNVSGSPMVVKFYLTYEDLSPNDAMIIHDFGGFPSSGAPGQSYPDSAVLMGGGAFTIQTIFNASPTLPVHKVKLHIYDANDSIISHEDLAFVSHNCNNSGIPIIINPSGQYCQGDSVTLTADNSYSNYQWSNGASSQSVYVPAEDVTTIIAEDAVGCLKNDTADISVTVPYEEQICIVSVDSATGKNIVVWEKTAMQATEQYYIYKESFQAGVYNLIGFVDYDSLSVFIDVNSNPLQQAERYKIAAVDSCGSVTDLAAITDHKTIHLTASIGTSNENNLVWDGYEGFSFPTYNIYRGDSPSNMSLLTQVASSAFTYSDLTPLSGDNYYKVEAVRSSACAPTQKSISYPSSVSNQVSLNPLGINNLNAKNVSVYPNPVENLLVVDLGAKHQNVSIFVKNVVGTVVMEETYNNLNKVELSCGFNEGVYFVEIMSNEKHLTTKKIIKQ